MKKEIRVLVYEPGTAGHRSVYLKYIVEALTEAGLETAIATQDFRSSAAGLLRYAVSKSCDIIFVCTLDGLYFWLITLGYLARQRQVKVVGVYYLFNNLYQGWKGYLWRTLLRLKLVHTIFVPDLLYARNVKGTLKNRIVQIPDAWDQRVLKSIPREEGFKTCGINDQSSCVFLVLGSLSLRKGIEQLLWCAEKWDYVKRPKFKLVIAGRADDNVRAIIDAFFLSHTELSNVVTVTDRWLSDEEICHFYAMASFLCAIYPKSFKVSISTVIRAFAVARPVVVGNHGMIGEIVNHFHSGLLCDTESQVEILRVIEKGYDIFMNEYVETYTRMANSGSDVAQFSELRRFKHALAEWGRCLNLDQSAK